MVVQFFLAGLGIVQLGNQGMDAHEQVGHLMELLALVLLVFALLAKYRGAILGMTIALFVLIVLQNVWANATVSGLAALHVLGALTIAMIIREIAGRASEANPRPARPTA